MKSYFLTGLFCLSILAGAMAQEEEHESESEQNLKRHNVGFLLGNAIIHGVQNSITGQEQYVLAPTFGIDYEYWINHKWAIGTYNEVSHVDIEVETNNEEEFIKRENTMLFSAVAVFEPFRNFGIFAGTGVETDPHHTLWIRYMGLEYTIMRCNDWGVGITLGYVNKDLYDAFTFGLVLGRRFGKNIPSRSHH